ncbi:MAG: bifunctional nuclease family protein [Polyangiaceae bacterium]|nr:bifunctional nuclease family protein [Polyangiaceae bacterium]MCE7892858.1 bifunctional nuclease family protein [Sorangiineae bacterium PRO1]MCL4753277.1 bifunctional nuclease family protein [Myxococcales bacterium]
MKPLHLAVVAVVSACGGAQAPAPGPAQPKVVVAESQEDDEPGQAPPACSAPERPRPIAPKLPNGYEEMTVGAVVPTAGGGSVVLVDARGKTGIPIFVGGSETTSIQHRLAGEKFVRPLTHDLLDAMLAKLDGRLVSARVDSLENNTFIGTVVMQKGSELVELDARASDAIALALGARAPIYVARNVIAQTGVSTSELGVGATPAAP